MWLLSFVDVHFYMSKVSLVRDVTGVIRDIQNVMPFMYWKLSVLCHPKLLNSFLSEPVHTLCSHKLCPNEWGWFLYYISIEKINVWFYSYVLIIKRGALGVGITLLVSSVQLFSYDIILMLPTANAIHWCNFWEHRSISKA